MRAGTPMALVLALAAVLATNAGGSTVEGVELRDVTLAGKVHFLAGFDPPLRSALSPTREQFAYVPRLPGNELSDELRVSDLRGGAPVVIHAPGGITDLAWAPTGRPIALAVSTPAQGPSGIWLVEPDGTNLRRVGDAGFGLAWSPDSRELAMAYRRNGFLIDTIRVLTIATGATRDIAEGTGPEWSPDGKTILYSWEFAYAHTPTEIRLVPAAGGDPRIVAQGSSGVWSPGGERIAYIARSGRSSDALWVVPSAGGGARLVAQGAESPMWLPNGRTLAFSVEHSPARCGFRTALSLVPLRGGKPRRLLVSRSGVEPLAWSPSGRKLTYLKIACA